MTVMPLSVLVKYIDQRILPDLSKIELMLDEPLDTANIFGGHFSGKAVIDDASGPIGYVVWSNEGIADREIVRIAVHPKYRRQNIGTLLLKELESAPPPVEAISASVPVHYTDVTRLLLSCGYEMSGDFRRGGLGYIRFLKWIV